MKGGRPSIAAAFCVLAILHPRGFAEEDRPSLYRSVADRLNDSAELSLGLTQTPPFRTDEAPKAGERLNIPPDAKSFLPDYMTTAAPGSLRPKDDSVNRDLARDLENYFKRFYPDVVFHLEWDDDTVNAYAWMEGDTRHVALYGGLLRHRAIQKEGIGLVLAHELGHHYGGEPRYPNSKLSCEGQADYWGAKDGMRTAWGEQYRNQMLPAIDQLYAFFSKGLVSSISPAQELEAWRSSNGCGHPPALCRKQTYEAALEGRPKPDCAGFAVPELAGAESAGTSAPGLSY